jgi:hypothetical protein
MRVRGCTPRRLQIIGLTGKESLNDEYFTQTLLPDYIEANPAECKRWDVLYDARGSLIEPHTNRQIPLGTPHCGYLDDFFKFTVRGIPRRCQVLLTDRTGCPARLDGKWASNGEIRPAITGSRECGLRVR